MKISGEKNRRIEDKFQVEGSNPGEIFQRVRGLAQNNDQINGQVNLVELTKNTGRIPLVAIYTIPK